MLAGEVLISKWLRKSVPYLALPSQQEAKNRTHDFYFETSTFRYWYKLKTVYYTFFSNCYLPEGDIPAEQAGDILIPRFLSDLVIFRHGTYFLRWRLPPNSINLLSLSPSNRTSHFHDRIIFHQSVYTILNNTSIPEIKSIKPFLLFAA